MNKQGFPMSTEGIAWRTQHRLGDVPKILRDAQVKAFVDQRLGDPVTFTQLAQECLELFGKERAPSRSALHRYWIRRRMEARGRDEYRPTYSHRSARPAT